MATTATWLIIVGFVLLVTGFVLRTVIMMRSSDTTAPGIRALHGRQLLVEYRKTYPRSSTPLLTRWFLISGTVLLLAGISVNVSR